MNNVCIRDLAETIGGKLRLGSMPPLAGELEPISRIAVDRRQVMPNDVFWCFPKPTEDGSHLAEEAYAQGALGVVAQRHVEPWAGRFSIEVADPHWALWQMARWTRQRFTGRVIAVTGGIGKSTTRQMIHAVLSARWRGSAKTYGDGDQTGLLQSLLDLDDDNDYGVFELPTGKSGAIEALGTLCQPYIGVITSGVQPSADRMNGSRGAAPEELLATLPSRGWVVLNGDDPHLRRLTDKTDLQTVRVGRSSDCDVVAENVRCHDGSLQFCIAGHQFRVPVSGRHHLGAALAAYAIGRMTEIAPEEIAGSLSRFRALPMHCEVVESGGQTWIDDTCHASPESMRAALELLRDFDSSGRRVVVCGDLDSPPQDAARLHRRVGDDMVTRCGADVLVACGEHASQVVYGARDAGMPKCQTSACTLADAARAVRDVVRPGDVVLIKGRPADTLRRVRRDVCERMYPMVEVNNENMKGHANQPVRANLLEALPFVSTLREVDATLPPG